MKKATSTKATLLVVAAFFIAAPSNAFAYIDPGSGSLLLQILMSAIFGALFMARNFLAKATAGLRRLISGDKATTVEEVPPPDKPVA